MATATISGGGKHGLAVLSHAERAAAENALAKLHGSNSGAATSATVFGGVKTGLSTSTLIQGRGSDTFLGGARNVSTHALSNVGNDTVVSGSATAGRSEAHNTHGFTLNSDTINIKGVTAEGVQHLHPQGAATGSHTITLADKTTVTVAGLSQHDMGKLPH